jgi:hypothetical protein
MVNESSSKNPPGGRGGYRLRQSRKGRNHYGTSGMLYSMNAARQTLTAATTKSRNYRQLAYTCLQVGIFTVGQGCLICSDSVAISEFGAELRNCLVSSCSRRYA